MRVHSQVAGSQKIEHCTTRGEQQYRVADRGEVQAVKQGLLAAKRSDEKMRKGIRAGRQGRHACEWCRTSEGRATWRPRYTERRHGERAPPWAGTPNEPRCVNMAQG